jgi:hypothetical protein
LNLGLINIENNHPNATRTALLTVDQNLKRGALQKLLSEINLAFFSSISDQTLSEGLLNLPREGMSVSGRAGRRVVGPGTTSFNLRQTGPAKAVWVYTWCLWKPKWKSRFKAINVSGPECVPFIG